MKAPECKICEGKGWVCESHPLIKWGDGDQKCCGGAGMPWAAEAAVWAAAEVAEYKKFADKLIELIEGEI